MKNHGYIYVLLDPTTKVIRYVGQTINPEQRYKSHIYLNNKNNKHHHINWLIKLKNQKLRPIMKIIDECLLADLNKYEKLYINLFKKLGYDLTNTSNEEYTRVYNKSRKHFIKQVYCYKEDNSYKIYTSGKEAAIDLNVSYKLISASCNGGKNIISSKYIFSLYRLSKKEIKDRFKCKIKRSKVKAINLKNKEEQIFNSQYQASKILNVNFRNINQVLKGVRKSAGGYLWQYYE